MSQADIGLIGLAVMGENLVLNMANHGFTVVVGNRSQDKVDKFIAGRAKGKSILGSTSVADLVSKLKTPRKIMIMVKAGQAVDDTINQLVPHLQAGDIIIDGGNTHYPDTNRRVAELEKKGLLFVGSGVSGGEEGALNGPSIMPGGSAKAWPFVKPIFQGIAAKADNEPCCDWVGEGGAGHYVKMVHNGIEYGDMQLICEAYQLMRDVLGMSAGEMHEVFKEWNKGDLDSYLIEITRDILAMKDADGSPLVDKILDAAGQKGTGKWTGINALDLGIPLTLIAESVFARCLSSIKEERVEASKVLKGPSIKFTGDKKAAINDIRDALYASKIMSYAQGYALMAAAGKEYGWKLNYGGIALMWRGGCIIRSAFLAKIKEAFDKDAGIKNLLLAPFFQEKVDKSQAGWRRVIGMAATYGVPTPTLSTALSYFDGYRTARLPANLLQAQRDFFGAHLYERVDKPRGEFFHTNWTGRGGDTVSTAYGV
jgi:6-phosphogluconate dehydrogenase